MKQATGQAPMPDDSARRERGSALRIAGWLVLLANVMVLFYLPAAQKLGRQRPHEIAIGLLVVLGVALLFTGARMRRPN
jgi:hypothetical protein